MEDKIHDNGMGMKYQAYPLVSMRTGFRTSVRITGIDGQVIDTKSIEMDLTKRVLDRSGLTSDVLAAIKLVDEDANW